MATPESKTEDQLTCERCRGFVTVEVVVASGVVVLGSDAASIRSTAGLLRAHGSAPVQGAMVAQATQAIAAAGATSTYPHDPFRFLERIRDTAYGGWGYSWSFSGTDANSTALVIQAYVASERAIPDGAIAALRRLQYPCGSFAFTRDAAGKKTGPDVGATVGAVLGLLRVARPVPDATLGPLPSPSTCPE